MKSVLRRYREMRFPQRSWHQTPRSDDSEQKAKSSAHSKNLLVRNAPWRLPAKFTCSVPQGSLSGSIVHFLWRSKGYILFLKKHMGGRFITWKHKSHSITHRLHKMYLRLTLESAMACCESIAFLSTPGEGVCFANSNNSIQWCCWS